MANNLTGDYEAVLQISVRQINGLLATLHQNGAKGSGLSPSFLHRLTNLRIGDRPRFLEPGILQVGQWLGQTLQSTQGFTGPAITARELAAKAPPGAKERFNAAIAEIVSAWTDVVPSGTVRGRAEVQLSTPAITLVRSDVVFHIYVRARFVPDSGSASLPAPIHGEVRIQYQVFVKEENGKKVLDFRPPAEDGRIQFFPSPGSGLSQADADTKISPRVRRAVRSQFQITPVELPGDFDYLGFKGLGSFGQLLDNTYVEALGTGSDQALVMPFRLSGAPSPGNGLGGLNNLLLGTGAGQSDFALAVSDAFLRTTFAPTLDRLRQISQTFDVSVPIWPDPTYRLTVQDAQLQFTSGFIDLVINAQAKTKAVFFPDYNTIVVTQRLTLEVIGGRLSLKASDADLTITGLPGSALNAARSEVTKARDSALPGAQSAVTAAFAEARGKINAILLNVDSSAVAEFESAAISADGIVVRGSIQTRFHYEPQLEIATTDDGRTFSALSCWIPGGRIDRQTWYWVETPSYVTSAGIRWVIPWGGSQKSDTEDHRFTFSIPQELLGRPEWDKGVCLTVEGVQVDAKGRLRSVTQTTASGTCSVTSHEPILVVDPLWEAIYAVLWQPDPAPESLVSEAIAGHVSLFAHSRPAGGLTTNGLVHFPGAELDRPLERIGRALALMQRRNVSLLVILVLPEGALKQRREVLERSLGLAGERLQRGALREPVEGFEGERHSGLRLILTEDVQGGWSKTFGQQAAPASYLMNALGEFVWQQQEVLDVEAMAAALDEHCLPVPAPGTPPLRLAVQPGQRALDVLPEDDPILPLRRWGGRQVLLLFCQPWSEPCLRELQQLLAERRERDQELVVINGGEDRSVLDEIHRCQEGRFSLIHDGDQRLSQLYGVSCWPTTVAINPAGFVERIQFGISHTHTPERERARGD